MSDWNLSQYLNLQTWFSSSEKQEAFSGQLNSTLEKVAPSVGIDLSQDNNIQGPPGSTAVNLPSFYDPNAGLNAVVNVNKIDKALEEQAWDMYTDLTYNRDIKFLDLDPQGGFCGCSESNPAVMEQQCAKLTEFNCKRVGCCVFTSDNKCKAGNEQGPSYDIAPVDYYYYKNKCYGNKCPAEKTCN
jgi:hypothetical protein